MFFTFHHGLNSKVFRFQDPDTGFKFEAEDFRSLIRHIKEYRKQNELDPLPMLELVVESYLCKQPENMGGCMPANVKLKRSFFTTIKGGIAILQNLLYSKMVSQEVADARSRICKTCPLNIFPDKGPFIQWSDRLAEASTDGRRSIHHSDLGNCAGCTCCLKAKVWYAGTITLKEEERTKMKAANPNCWQL